MLNYLRIEREPKIPAAQMTERKKRTNPSTEVSFETIGVDDEFELLEEFCEFDWLLESCPESIAFLAVSKSAEFMCTLSNFESLTFGPVLFPWGVFVDFGAIVLMVVAVVAFAVESVIVEVLVHVEVVVILILVAVVVVIGVVVVVDVDEDVLFTVFWEVLMVRSTLLA